MADTACSVASGIVVALQANYLEVELDVAPDGCPGRLLCTRRTRLSHRGEAVYVGDRVRVEAIDPGQGRAVVAEVEPCLLYTSPSPRDSRKSRMPSSA